MYSLETYKNPFWAKSSNFTRGRDPLGIQNSSISIYATLLPGMTNLTLRLRYYGLYLWLLDEYDKLPSNNIFKSDFAQQYNFVRRAELVIALLMRNNFPKEQSIIGSNFADKHLSELNQSGSFDIALGADKNKDTIKGSVYWDYNSGALGQYYAGSLIALSLIEFKEGFFRRTDVNGVNLAQAYRNSISEESSSLFLSIISNGTIKLSDLNLLEDFSISKDYYNTEEGAFYLEMLLSDDGVKYSNIHGLIPRQRRETISIFLNHFKSKKNDASWEDLPRLQYINVLNNYDIIGAQFGWYYYYLNELTHFSLESFFWALLYEIDKGSYTIHQFSQYISQEVNSEIKSLLNINQEITVEKALTMLNDNNDTLDLIRKIEEEIKNNNSFQVCSLSVVLLFRLYNENNKLIDKLKEYVVSNSLQDKNGNVLSIFEEYINNKMFLNLSEYITQIVLKLINEHTRIAYSKMGNGDKNLLKFIVEDNFLIHIETMKPNFTNPRLKTLYNFTCDLGLLDGKSTLTDLGEDLINQLTEHG